MSSSSSLYGDPPSGGRSEFIEASDGTRLRASFWRAKTPKAETILFVQGRTEFTEKYYPTIERYLSLGYNFATFDLRGQGRSDRATSTSKVGHVDDFEEYQIDLETVVVWLEGFGHSPKILAAHSMGGCIALTRLLQKPAPFSKAILTAPMLGISLPGMFEWCAAGLARGMCIAGASKAALPGTGGRTQTDTPFDANVLTLDKAQYERSTGWVRAHPDLAVSGPSWGWLSAAIDAMQDIQDAPENSLSVPSLCLLAEDDQVVSNDASTRFAERQDAMTLHSLADSQHEPYLAQSGPFEEHWSQIEKFLAAT